MENWSENDKDLQNGWGEKKDEWPCFGIADAVGIEKKHSLKIDEFNYKDTKYHVAYFDHDLDYLFPTNDDEVVVVFNDPYVIVKSDIVDNEEEENSIKLNNNETMIVNKLLVDIKTWDSVEESINYRYYFYSYLLIIKKEMNELSLIIQFIMDYFYKQNKEFLKNKDYQTPYLFFDSFTINDDITKSDTLCINLIKKNISVFINDDVDENINVDENTNVDEI